MLLVLTDLVVFGRAAALRAGVTRDRAAPIPKVNPASEEKILARFDRLRHANGTIPTAELRDRMQHAMQDDAAVFRTGETLRNGVKNMQAIYADRADLKVTDRSMIWNSDLIETLELENLLANALTNFLDPNYKIPAQWKYNLSLAFRPDLSAARLGTGWTFRGDVLFSDTQEAPVWKDIRAQPLVVGGVTQVAPDGRPRYDASVGGNYDIELTNTNRGISRVFAIGATKSTRDFDITAAYTHSVVHDVAGALASSTVSSNYGVVTDSPNSGGAYGRSSFEIRQIIRGNFELHKQLIGDNETRFGVNWEHRSGQPYSITMTDGGARGAVFGTALNNSAHLLYVPDFSQTPVVNSLGTQVGNVVFDSTTTYNAVLNLVRNTDLNKYQGKIAPKNLLTGPSYDKVDLNLAQQIPFFHHSKITALFSMENFLNFLNRDWGSYLDYGTANSVVQVTCVGAATGGQTCPLYKYSSYNAPTTTAYAKPSLFAVRLGARLDF